MKSSFTEIAMSKVQFCGLTLQPQKASRMFHKSYFLQEQGTVECSLTLKKEP